jgi:hypothetical protein
MNDPKETKAARGQQVPAESAGQERRRLLKKLARFAAVSAPTVTLLMAAKSKPAAALPSGLSSRQFKTGAGSVDSAAVLAAVASGVATAAIDPIDGIGLCIAAIKGLAVRIGGLEQAAAL